MRVKNKRKFAFLSLVLSFFVLTLIVVTPRNLSVKAEDDKKYTVSGSVYCQSGNSDYWLSKGNLYLKVQMYDLNYNLVASSAVDTYGQYVLTFSGNYKSSDKFRFDIVSAYSLAVYQFNSLTKDLYLYGLVADKVNYVDLYIHSYLFSTNMSNPISNYLPGLILINGKDGAVASRFQFLDNSLDYWNNFTFEFSIDLTSYISGKEVPAFWINANDTYNKSWLFGCGFYAINTPTDEYPWQFYFKDNKSQFSLPIYKLKNSDFSLAPIFHFMYKVSLINDLPVLQVFYHTDSGSFYRLLYQVSLPEKIGSLELQSFNCSASLQFSYTFNNLSYVRKDYSDIYDNGYSAGKIDGERIGYSLGFAAASNTDYSFNALLTAIFDVPVKTITKLFNVEILGVNLSDFVLSIATVFIVIALVKFFLGIFVGGD